MPLSTSNPGERDHRLDHAEAVASLVREQNPLALLGGRDFTILQPREVGETAYCGGMGYRAPTEAGMLTVRVLRPQQAEQGYCLLVDRFDRDEHRSLGTWRKSAVPAQELAATLEGFLKSVAAKIAAAARRDERLAQTAQAEVCRP
jgi:hypothetical protein